MLDSPTDCKPSPTMERSIPVSLVKFMVSAPKSMPVGAPTNDKKNVSTSMRVNTFDLFIPIAMSIPSSFLRSKTAISMVLMIPKISASMMMIMMRKSHVSITSSA